MKGRPDAFDAHLFSRLIPWCLFTSGERSRSRRLVQTSDVPDFPDGASGERHNWTGATRAANKRRISRSFPAIRSGTTESQRKPSNESQSYVYNSISSPLATALCETAFSRLGRPIHRAVSLHWFERLRSSRSCKLGLQLSSRP